jgi:hypothetical protein
MTIHKIKLYYSITGSDEFHSSLQQWHDFIQSETTDLITNEIPDAPVSQVGSDANSEYYTVTHSYPSTENPTEILEQSYKKLVKYCNWSKIGYHQCGDVPDNSIKSDCHYPEDQIYRNGDIPEYIPSLN